MNTSFIQMIENLYKYLLTTEEVAKWLNTPNLVLDNKSPIWLISNGKLDMVMALVEEIKSGMTV